MSDQVLATPDELAAELAEPQTPTLVFDATVDLATAHVDGDYRVEPGRRAWADRHLPGARHLDLLTDVVDGSRGFHFARPTRAVLLDALESIGDRASTPGGPRRRPHDLGVPRLVDAPRSRTCPCCAWSNGLIWTTLRRRRSRARVSTTP